MTKIRTHAVRASDGWVLDVADIGPEEGDGAVVVAGHAMMVDRRTLLRTDRPCVARSLVARGHRVLLPDLRGHGRSGPRPAAGGEWTYDDLVSDVGAYLRLARELGGDRPVVLLGHSLFGHNALAHVGLRPAAPVAAIVLLAVDVWLREHERSRLHWLAKKAMLAAGNAAVRRFGHMPARRFRLGTMDEAAGYWTGFLPTVSRGWRASDGIDYLAAIRRVPCPVLHVVSRGDLLYARPSSALRLTQGLPQREAVELGATADAALDALAPTHMGLVTDPACEPAWDHVARWIRERAPSRPASADRVEPPDD